MRLKRMTLVIYLKEKLILKMMILVIDEPDNEDDDISCFQNNTIGVQSKLMNEMGFDWNSLGKNGKGIENPKEICITPRNEGLSYEGHTSNGEIKIVKEETSTNKKVTMDSSMRWTINACRSKVAIVMEGRDMYKKNVGTCILALFVVFPITIITNVGA